MNATTADTEHELNVMPRLDWAWVQALDDGERDMLREMIVDRYGALFDKLRSFTTLWGESLVTGIAAGIQPSHRHIMRRKIRRCALMCERRQ